MGIGGRERHEDAVRHPEWQVDEKRQQPTDRLHGQCKRQQRRHHLGRVLQPADGANVTVVVRVEGGRTAVQEGMERDEPEQHASAQAAAGDQPPPEKDWRQQKLEMQPQVDEQALDVAGQDDSAAIGLVLRRRRLSTRASGHPHRFARRVHGFSEKTLRQSRSVRWPGGRQWCHPAGGVTQLKVALAIPTCVDIGALGRMPADGVLHVSATAYAGAAAVASRPRPPRVSSVWQLTKPARSSVAVRLAGVKRPWSRLNGRHRLTESKWRGSRLTPMACATVAARSLGSIRTSRPPGLSTRRISESTARRSATRYRKLWPVHASRLAVPNDSRAASARTQVRRALVSLTCRRRRRASFSMRGAISRPISRAAGNRRANSNVDTPGPQPRSAIQASSSPPSRAAMVAQLARQAAWAVNQA